MTEIKPLESMKTPRFADIATFFRLPIIKDLINKNLSLIENKPKFGPPYDKWLPKHCPSPT